jgi:hypothetical protein
MVQLRHDLETIQSAPEYDSYSLPSEDYQRAIREYYGHAWRSQPDGKEGFRDGLRHSRRVRTRWLWEKVVMTASVTGPDRQA